MKKKTKIQLKPGVVKIASETTFNIVLGVDLKLRLGGEKVILNIVVTYKANDYTC